MPYSMTASADKGVSRAFTSLHLIGATDIDCDNLHPHRVPDLKTEGGAIFKGSVAIIGDICIGGTVLGNVSGNFSGNLTGDISVEGDLDVGGNITSMDGFIGNLDTDLLCVNDELFVDFISPKTGNVVNVGNVTVHDLTVTGNVNGNIGTTIGNSLTLETLTSNIVTANTICVNDELIVDTLNSKSGNAINLGDVVVDDITINGVISGNINVDVSNITMLTLETLTGNLVDANIVCVNTELQTDLIVPKTGNIISIGGSVLPTANVTFDLGSSPRRWNKIYADEILISNIDGLSPISAKTDFIPSENLTFELGILSQRWKTIFVKDIDTSGNLNGNLISGNNATVSNTITSNNVIGNIVTTNQIDGTGNGVIIEGVVVFNSNFTANVINSNIGCIEEMQTTILTTKDSAQSIGLSGNVIPTQDQTFSLGNLTNKIDSIFVNDITVCGKLLGNVTVGVGNNIVTDTVTANIVCVNDEIQTDIINEKTASSGVTVDGVLHLDSNVTAEVITANVVSAGLLLDYKRTVVNTPTYTMEQEDDIIAVKATANGIVTLTLPLISSLVRKRKRYAIVDEAGHSGANAIVITTSGSDKIFAGSSWMLSGDFNAVQIYSDETDNWFAI